MAERDLSEMFPDNSITNRNKDPEEAPHVKTYQTVQKNGKGSFFKDIFVADVKDIAKSVVREEIDPAVRSLFVNSINKAARMLMYNGSEPPSSIRSGNPSYRRDYTKPYQSTYDTKYSQTRKMIDDVVFDTRNKAEEFCDDLRAHIDNYECLTVRRFNAMLNRPGTPSDNSWGWRDLSRMTIINYGRDWYVQMPKPQPI